MTDYFRFAFGVLGDTDVIPDDTQPDGTVSFQEGFGEDYSLDLTTDPDARAIPREEFNYLMNRVTAAIRYLQTNSGIPEYIPAAENGNTPFPYGIGARVIYLNAIYQSKINNNTTLPTTAANWTPVSKESLLGALTVKNEDIAADANISISKLADGTINDAEFLFLSGVSANLQEQLDDKQPVGAYLVQSDLDAFFQTLIMDPPDEVLISGTNFQPGDTEILFAASAQPALISFDGLIQPSTSYGYAPNLITFNDPIPADIEKIVLNFSSRTLLSVPSNGSVVNDSFADVPALTLKANISNEVGKPVDATVAQVREFIGAAGNANLGLVTKASEEDFLQGLDDFYPDAATLIALLGEVVLGRANIRQEENSLDPGGTTISNQYNKILLNTEHQNTMPDFVEVINDDQDPNYGSIVLQPGKYRFNGDALAYYCNTAQSRLFNETTSLEIESGRSVVPGFRSGSQSANAASTGISDVKTAVIEFEEETRIRMDIWVQTGFVDTGLGFPSSSGAREIYSSIEILRVL